MSLFPADWNGPVWSFPTGTLSGGARRVLQEMALRQELCLTADEPCGSDEVCIYRGLA